MFPQVLLGITLSWLICYLLTIYNVLPSDPDKYGYLARTDIKGDVVGRAPWFRFPYPGILSRTIKTNKVFYMVIAVSYMNHNLLYGIMIHIVVYLWLCNCIPRSMGCANY